ncbi:T9SS type A sorting domain-containing protein [uncultured Kordia sp.]|uniref:T9SS type A sorting domain-containing protein n=1 Tax=uncultured Kordia sp. TaxID=507699 RepID=UPI00344B4901
MKIIAYPNPVTNSFQISSNNSIENVKLYNITGRLLKTFNERVHYNISDLVAGIYFVNIKTDLGSKVFRLIKK